MKLKLHTQILIGFVLGIAFGAVFKVDHHQLTIESTKELMKSHRSGRNVDFLKGDSVIKLFGTNSQTAIIKYFESLNKNQ